MSGYPEPSLAAGISETLSSFVKSHVTEGYRLGHEDCFILDTEVGRYDRRDCGLTPTLMF